MNLLQRLMNRRNKKGFTLIEMIVVIAIIAILIALLVPSIIGFIRDSRETAGNAAAKNIFVAAQTYAARQYAQGKTVTAIQLTDLSDYLNANTIPAGATAKIDIGTGADNAGVVIQVTYTDSTGSYGYPDAPVSPTVTP